MDEEEPTPALVEALPLDERADRYLAAQRRLEARLDLPVA